MSMLLSLQHMINLPEAFELYHWMNGVFNRAYDLNFPQLVQYCRTTPLPLDPDTATDLQGARPYSFDDPDVHKILTRRFQRTHLDHPYRDKVFYAIEEVFGIDMGFPPCGSDIYYEKYRNNGYIIKPEPGGAPEEPERVEYGMDIRGILHALYERLAMLERAYVMMYEHL